MSWFPYQPLIEWAKIFDLFKQYQLSPCASLSLIIFLDGLKIAYIPHYTIFYYYTIIFNTIYFKLDNIQYCSYPRCKHTVPINPKISASNGNCPDSTSYNTGCMINYRKNVVTPPNKTHPTQQGTLFCGCEGVLVTQ